MAETSNAIKSEIDAGKYTVTQRHKGKSLIWNILCEILREDGTVVEGWIFCSTCRKVLKFIINQTSNLSRHKCCITLRKPKELKKVSESDKKEAIEKCTQWVVQDCRRSRQ